MSRLVALATPAACTSNSTELTVTPDPTDVLTCSQVQFTASDANASWAATPGAIDATGLYTAPDTMAATSAQITATAGGASAIADVTLATAFPGAPATIPTAPGNAGLL